MLNTLIGFFAGLYFPLGYLSDKIAVIVKVFPLSHSAALFRDIMTKNILQGVIKNTPLDVVREMKLNYGIELKIGEHLLNGNEVIIYILTFGLIFYIGSVIKLKHYKRK